MNMEDKIAALMVELFNLCNSLPHSNEGEVMDTYLPTLSNAQEKAFLTVIKNAGAKGILASEIEGPSFNCVSLMLDLGDHDPRNTYEVLKGKPVAVELKKGSWDDGLHSTWVSELYKKEGEVWDALLTWKGE